MIRDILSTKTLVPGRDIRAAIVSPFDTSCVAARRSRGLEGFVAGRQTQYIPSFRDNCGKVKNSGR